MQNIKKLTTEQVLSYRSKIDKELKTRIPENELELSFERYEKCGHSVDLMDFSCEYSEKYSGKCFDVEFNFPLLISKEQIIDSLKQRDLMDYFDEESLPEISETDTTITLYLYGKPRKVIEPGYYLLLDRRIEVYIDENKMVHRKNGNGTYSKTNEKLKIGGKYDPRNLLPKTEEKVEDVTEEIKKSKKKPIVVRKGEIAVIDTRKMTKVVPDLDITVITSKGDIGVKYLRNKKLFFMFDMVNSHFNLSHSTFTYDETILDRNKTAEDYEMNDGAEIIVS